MTRRGGSLRGERASACSHPAHATINGSSRPATRSQYEGAICTKPIATVHLLADAALTLILVAPRWYPLIEMSPNGPAARIAECRHGTGASRRYQPNCSQSPLCPCKGAPKFYHPMFRRDRRRDGSRLFVVWPVNWFKCDWKDRRRRRQTGAYAVAATARLSAAPMMPASAIIVSTAGNPPSATAVAPPATPQLPPRKVQALMIPEP